MITKNDCLLWPQTGNGSWDSSMAVLICVPTFLLENPLFKVRKKPSYQGIDIRVLVDSKYVRH